jgi:transcriptional regulator with XRE-family HTH domain
MSLKTAFASVLKATRVIRGLSQKNLAEVSSRTYISKLERGQCSPTLEMITSLSVPLNLSPLTLMALTIRAESGQPMRSLVNRLQNELAELADAGVLDSFPRSIEAQTPLKQNSIRIKSGRPAHELQQAEFCFAE